MTSVTEEFRPARTPAPGPDAARLGRAGGKVVFAIADQALIAGSNFLLNVLLARLLSTEGYGAFALAFSIFLLVANSYQAILLTPSLVLAVTVFATRRAGYLAALLRFHVVVSVVVAAGFGGAAAVCTAFPGTVGFAPALAGLAISTPCVLLLWLVRSVYYIDMAPRQAALGAFGYCCFLTALLFLGRSYISTFTAFLATGGASLVVALLLLTRLPRHPATAQDAVPFAELWRESWEFGRWELATSLVIWVTSGLCYPLTAAALGATYAGALRGLQNFSLPFTHAFVACLRLAVPYASRQYETEGRGVAARLVYALLGVAIVVSLAYMGLIVALGTLPTDLLYGGKFGEFVSLIPLVLLGALLGSSIEAVGVGLRATRNHRGLFLAYLAAALPYLLLGYPAAVAFGLTGVIAGLAAANGVALVTALVLFQRPAPEARS